MDNRLWHYQYSLIKIWYDCYNEVQSVRKDRFETEKMKLMEQICWIPVIL